MSPNKGRMIVVEGLEGAGKSTALHTIKQYLAPLVPSLINTREPGGTHVGEVVRELVKGFHDTEPLDSRSELLLFYAARVQLLNQVILPALAKGAWILADRFELSTWAYQGGGRKLDEGMIQALSKFCLQGFEPDLILYLDISPELGLARAKARGNFDRIEQEAIGFFNDVYTSYHKHIRLMKNVVVIDASQSLEEVQVNIRTTLQVFLNEHDAC